MHSLRKVSVVGIALLTLLALAAGPAAAQQNSINGQITGAGIPIAGSTVTLWAASAGAPQQLAQTRTGADGRFALDAVGGGDAVLYLVAKGGQPVDNKASGDNPAIAFLAVVGATPPARVTVNEMTTIASVITHTQFIDGTVIRGSPLALRIAAGNVSNFVDLNTGHYGATILDPLNSAQTPTMANFGTLANILAACASHR